MATQDNTDKQELLIKYGEFMEWLERINETIPELQKMLAELQKMQSQINNMQKQIKKELAELVEVAETHSKKAAESCERVEAIAKRVESQEEVINQSIIKISNYFNGGNGTSISVEIEAEPEEETIEELMSHDGKIKLKIDEDADKLQLHFSSSSVSAPYREYMKDNGFRYYRPGYCWTADNNTTNYLFAKNLIEQHSE